MNTRVDRMLQIPRRRRMRSHPAPTFLFVDLAGFTALTERRGDEAAAEVAREFRRTMRSLSRQYGAWQVKSMGDGVMIWAPDAARAVALAARAVEEIGDGAARLADEAEPGQALISGATLSAALGRLAHPLKLSREIVLRGIDRPILAWRLT
jgi:class 3 adenylate cyclase